jgi:flagellar motor switch/type III secretory pathway protein FliN
MGTLADLNHLADIPVRFEALLPGPVLRVGELLALVEGSIVNTGQPAGETVQVFAGGALIGFAEISDTSDRRAVRMVHFQTEGR